MILMHPGRDPIRPTAADLGIAGWATLTTALVVEQMVELPPDASPWWALVGAAGWSLWAIGLRQAVVRIPSRWPSRRRAAVVWLSGAWAFVPPVAVTLLTAARAAPTFAGGEGASPEGILLAVLRGMLLVGVVVGTACTQTAFTIGATVFLVTLSTVVVDHPAVGIATAWYALAASCWLATRRRRATVAAHGPPTSVRHRVAVRPAVLIAPLAVAAIVGALGGRHDPTGRAIAGWMPFSGGDSWAFPWARDGIGDGENLVAARETPQATGPVDSHLFLTSHQPSLFDMFDDLYGEPPKPQADRRQRAIALDLPLEQRPRGDQHFADSAHAGRTFSTVRRPSRRRRPASDIAARAVVSVTGPMPVHLRLEVFDRFDGRDWRPAGTVDGPSSLAHVGGDWMEWTGAPARPSNAAPDLHDVVVGTLRTPTLPLPTQPVRLRIDRIDRADFFRTPAAEVATLDGVDIPAGTTVQALSAAGGIDAAHWPTVRPAHATDDVPGWVRDLVVEWQLPVGGDVTDDFFAASRVVAELSRRCTLDPDAVLPAECPDTLRHFLVESRRGPAFCFAGAATLLLRACGYDSRLAGGLYLDGKRRDARSRRVVAGTEDAHVWAEVADQFGRWIPVEATPGFSLRGTAIPWWRRMQALFDMRPVTDHVPLFALLGMVGLTIALVRIWRDLADALATLSWRVWIGRRDTCPLAVTWRLVEWRAWLAGCPRPAHETARGWYVEACRDPGGSSAVGFVSALETVAYGPRTTCRDRVAHLRIARDAATTLTRARLRAGRAVATPTRRRLAWHRERMPLGVGSPRDDRAVHRIVGAAS